MCFWHMVRVHEHKFLFGVLVYKGRAGVSMVRKKKGGGEEEEEEGYGYIQMEKAVQQMNFEQTIRAEFEHAMII